MQDFGVVFGLYITAIEVPNIPFMQISISFGDWTSFAVLLCSLADVSMIRSKAREASVTAPL